jgi:hypothetical protein
MCWACVTSADGDAVEMTGELRGYEYTDEQMAMADTIIERLRRLLARAQLISRPTRLPASVSRM